MCGSLILNTGSGFPVPKGPTKLISVNVSGVTSLKFNSKSKSFTSRSVFGLKLFSKRERSSSSLSAFKDKPQAKSCPPNLSKKSSFIGSKASNKLKPLLDRPEPFNSPFSSLVRTRVGL